jgi:hypothetical protein
MSAQKKTRTSRLQSSKRSMGDLKWIQCTQDSRGRTLESGMRIPSPSVDNSCYQSLTSASKASLLELGWTCRLRTAFAEKVAPYDFRHDDWKRDSRKTHPSRNANRLRCALVAWTPETIARLSTVKMATRWNTPLDHGSCCKYFRHGTCH